MRFFTDNFFTESQKAEMLGRGYGKYTQEQLRESALQQERELRQRNAELESTQLRNQQKVFDRNEQFAGFAVLAIIMLIVLLVSSTGSTMFAGGS
jgi:hypothetical protein